MIYINIPSGWKFDNKNYPSDVLVKENSETGKVKPEEIIELQSLIKDCLRTKKRHATSFSLDLKDTHNEKITIFFKRAPEGNYLEYHPNRNGKFKAEKAEIILKKEIQQVSFSNSHTGLLWFQRLDRCALNPKRREEVEKMALEQKANRRHNGDSPKAT